MKETLHRYPGAQPFHDDELSRQTFFGRAAASAALTDQILANRLLIVYAKSGLGKTSLLNAGVAPLLREAGSIPLFVRVNDVQKGSMSSVLEGVRAEADRQGVEYVPGNESSLWAFFKTVEFWRDDLLLSPVLIVDQFEELFTLQSLEERERFLSELACLLRGVPPPTQGPIDPDISDAPPVIRVVLSLREDFLGLLEEASDQIPAIMDNRFRLAPLSIEMASQAITGPAAIEHEGISTRAFRLEPECIASILNYLTRSTTATRARGAGHVEPFHLQLICQRIETVAAFKQKTVTGELLLSYADLGGEKAMGETLKGFYTDAILSLPRRFRGAARRMCERTLISREGRRLSVEERELCGELRLRRETLRQLVERRLLRTDRRADNTYYELSHDALVLPVLASRQTQSFILYTAAIFAGSITCLCAAALTVLPIFAYIAGTDKSPSMYAVVGICIAIGLLLVPLAVAWLRAGIRRRSRYGQPTRSDSAEAVPKRAPLWKRVIGWTLLITTPTFLLVWGGYGLVGLIQYTVVAFKRGQIPESLVWMVGGAHMAWQLMHDHPFQEMLWWVVVHATIVLFGWWVFRQADQLIWPQGFITRSRSANVPGVDESSSPILALLKFLSGGFTLAISVLGFFTLRTCNTSWHGAIPYWIGWPIVSYRLSGACQLIYQHDGWTVDEFNFALFFAAAFVLSLVWLVGGALDLRAALRYRRIAQGESGRRQALIATGACGILIAGLFWMWMALPRPAVLGGAESNVSQHPGHGLNTLPAGLHSGWAAGNEATILHTDDDGRTWKSQTHGTGWLYSIAFSTREMGCAVGAHGTIWYTENGGDSWTELSTGIQDSLSEVAFVTPRLGWAIGDQGVIVHTINGGSTWSRQSSNTQENLRGVAFPTPLLGWAVGDEGTILHTEDGGQTWKPQPNGNHAMLDFVAFSTPQLGWASGHDGTILHTDNGGAKWQVQSSGTVNNLYGMAFTNPQSGWVVGEMGTILHTEDAGRTWTAQETDSRAEFREVSFVSPQSGWVVSTAGIILRTSDGGRTWEKQQSGTRVTLAAVAFLKPYGILGIQFNKDPSQSKTPLRGHGAVIDQVSRNGPASRAGLQAGDVIIAVNGERVESSGDLRDAIYAQKPGVAVTLIYIRGGKTKTINVILGDGSKASG